MCFWWSQNDNESLLWADRRNAPMVTKNTSVRSISPPEKLFCLSNLPTRRAIMLNYRRTQTAQNQGFWLHKKKHSKWTFLGKYKGDLKSNIFWNRFLLAMADRSVSAGIPTCCRHRIFLKIDLCHAIVTLRLFLRFLWVSETSIEVRSGGKLADTHNSVRSPKRTNWCSELS